MMDECMFPSYHFHVLPPPLGLLQHCLSLGAHTSYHTPLPANAPLSQPTGLNAEQSLEDVIWPDPRSP